MVLEGEKCLNRRYIRAIYTICRIHATVVWDLRQCSVLLLYIVIAPLWLLKHCLTWKKCRGYYRVQSDILLMYNTQICTHICTHTYMHTNTEYYRVQPEIPFVYTHTYTHLHMKNREYYRVESDILLMYTHTHAHKGLLKYIYIHITNITNSHAPIHWNIHTDKYMCAHKSYPTYIHLYTIL